MRHLGHLRLCDRSGNTTVSICFFKRYTPFMIFAHKRWCAVLFGGGTKSRRDVILATRGEFGCVTLLYSARCSSPFAPHMGSVFIITKFKTESHAVIKNGKRKRPAPNRHGSKIKSAASQKNSGVVAAIAA